MTIISISALVVLILSIAFYAWYYCTVKRPVDKEMKDSKKRLDTYEKYKSEIRNFKK